MTTVGRQLRDNAVALISLVVALGSLGYNTWRNERTEHNRNVRAAAFELLMRLADLKRVVFLAQYDRDQAGGNPRTGWPTGWRFKTSRSWRLRRCRRRPSGRRGSGGEIGEAW